MRVVKAKDCFTGEMITTDFDEFMLHSYWKVVGHNHEKKYVILEKGHLDEDGSYKWGPWEHKIPYDNYVRVRPEAPLCANEEFREQCLTYKFWPYDSEGNFSFTPHDWRFGRPLRSVRKLAHRRETND
tara:strand:- start:3915 stop:4298 length:384 start_codon:yes stop_codon:yes gene_type:complete